MLKPTGSFGEGERQKCDQDLLQRERSKGRIQHGGGVEDRLESSPDKLVLFEIAEKGIVSIDVDCLMDQKPPKVSYPDACSDATQMQVQKKLIVSQGDLGGGLLSWKVSGYWSWKMGKAYPS